MSKKPEYQKEPQNTKDFGATGFNSVEIYPDAYSLQTASHVGCWFALYTLNGIAERKANEGK